MIILDLTPRDIRPVFNSSSDHKTGMSSSDLMWHGSMEGELKKRMKEGEA
jgi:hypothetical protein